MKERFDPLGLIDGKQKSISYCNILSLTQFTKSVTVSPINLGKELNLKTTKKRSSKSKQKSSSKRKDNKKKSKSKTKE